MSGIDSGALFTNILLTALVGFYAWKRTRNATKVTIVVLIAIISPIIGMFVAWIMKPYKKEENKIEQEPAKEAKNNNALNSEVRCCRFCGAELEADAKFCNKCGRGQEE